MPLVIDGRVKILLLVLREGSAHGLWDACHLGGQLQFVALQCFLCSNFRGSCRLDKLRWQEGSVLPSATSPGGPEAVQPFGTGRRARAQPRRHRGSRSLMPPGAGASPLCCVHSSPAVPREHPALTRVSSSRVCLSQPTRCARAHSSQPFGR